MPIQVLEDVERFSASGVVGRSWIAATTER